jgi:zinc protease
MKKIAQVFVILIGLFSINAASAAIPKVQEITTPKGYKPWMVEDHYLPIVSIKLAFKNSGTAYDAKDKLGLAYMVASLLDEGAGGISPLDFRKKLEELATSISFDVDEDDFFVSLKTLSENVPESLRLLNLALTKADFDPQAVERIRNQILVLLTKNEESPEYVAGRRFREEIFTMHPYSNTKYGTKETIPNITRDDLAAFVKNNLTAKNALISVVGDLTTAKVSSLLDSTLQLPPGARDTQKLPEVTINNKGQTIYIEKPLPQSVVIFGEMGVKRSDPDFYPAFVMNHILGGGNFESRLMNEVREKNGLAYTVYSYLDLMQKAGLLVGYVATDKNKVDNSIELIKKEVAKLANNGVTETELQAAKDYIINSFPLKMTKNSDIADFLIIMQTESLGMDFMDKRNDYVNAVTLNDVNLAAKKLLNVDNLIFVVVGSHK